MKMINGTIGGTTYYVVVLSVTIKHIVTEPRTKRIARDNK